MDEIEKMQMKNGALIKARDYLLNQRPSNMVALADVTEMIVDLTKRNLAATNASKIPQVAAKEERSLRELIESLDKSLQKEASAGHILRGAKNVYASAAAGSTDLCWDSGTRRWVPCPKV